MTTEPSALGQTQVNAGEQGTLNILYEGGHPLQAIGESRQAGYKSTPVAAAKLTENQKARKYGIPRWLKRYNARYGEGGVDRIVAVHLQNPTSMLNHGRDRAARGKT